MKINEQTHQRIRLNHRSFPKLSRAHVRDSASRLSLHVADYKSTDINEAIA